MTTGHFKKLAALALVTFVLSACGGTPPPAVEPAAAPAALSAELAGVYERSCKTCHGQGGTGAPMAGDRAAWAPRLALGRELILERTLQGYRGMPPFGLCMDCTEDQFIALIEFMAGGSFGQ